MPEPVTLAVLGAAAFTQGINFLYGQAAERLKRRRERRDGALAADTDNSVLDCDLAAADADEYIVEEFRDQLRMLTEQLRPYATGEREMGEPPDVALIAKWKPYEGSWSWPTGSTSRSTATSANQPERPSTPRSSPAGSTVSSPWSTSIGYSGAAGSRPSVMSATWGQAAK